MGFMRVATGVQLNWHVLSIICLPPSYLDSEIYVLFTLQTSVLIVLQTALETINSGIYIIIEDREDVHSSNEPKLLLIMQKGDTEV